ncbi:MAG: DUF480 domain-containing protein [Pseudomonadota bacterium]
MPIPLLTDNELRVLGCLLEKAVTTPDQYPLTLNALTNACNQKSGRNPVMKLSKGQVERAALDLAEKHFVKEEENFKTGMKKYHQRFCNTGLHGFQFDSAQYAVVTLAMLRGPQTPGEIRSRSGRLHEFADNSEVMTSLQSLMEGEAGALFVKLPRTPGRKDSEFMHLLSGVIDLENYAPEAPEPSSGGARLSVAELAERLSALEQEVMELKARLGE